MWGLLEKFKIIIMIIAHLLAIYVMFKKEIRIVSVFISEMIKSTAVRMIATMDKIYAISMSSLMLILGITLVVLAPIAFNKGQNYIDAYGNFGLFLLLALISAYFTNVFYQEHLDNKKATN